MKKIHASGKVSFSALVLLMILCSRLPLAFAGMDDWTMFHHDPANTGCSTSTAPDSSKLLWSYKTGGYVISSPAVADGRVYVGSNDNKVYCLDASTGAHIWNYTTGSDVQSSPAVVDGRVYVGSLDNKVYCLDAGTGAHIWNYTTGLNVYSSPAVADGRVYVGSTDHKIYCFGSAITLDDIMNELQALRDIEAEVDNIEIKLDSILERLGLPPVGGSIVLKEELSYILNLISENLAAVTLIITAVIVYLLLAKRMS